MRIGDISIAGLDMGNPAKVEIVKEFEFRYEIRFIDHDIKNMRVKKELVNVFDQI